MEFGLPALSVLFYVLWICFPIIPASFIYWLFPKDKVPITLPILNRMTLNTAGAFLAYVIVFIIGYPTVKNSLDLLRTINPTVKIDLDVIVAANTHAGIGNLRPFSPSPTGEKGARRYQRKQVWQRLISPANQPCFQ